MTTPEQDEALAARALHGEREALAALYQRYFSQVYDLALRLLRDADRAADVAQDTFLRFIEAKEAPHTSVRAWLYTVARHLALDEIRRRKRAAPQATAVTDDGEDVFSQIADPGPGPERLAVEKETARLVWEAARALRPEDYSLLDLHLRKGLDPDELAQVLGASKGNVYTMLSRLRDALEEALTALLVAKQGKRSCPALAQIVIGTEATGMTPRLRRQVLRHLKECESCQAVRRRHVSAAELLASLAPVPPSLALQKQVLAQLLEQLPLATGPSVSPASDAVSTPRGEPAAQSGGPSPAQGVQLGTAAAKGGLWPLVGTVAKVAIIATAVVGLAAAGAFGALAAWGSSQIRVENVNCAPLALALPGALKGVPPLPVLGLPRDPISPGTSAILRLPAGQVAMEVALSQISIKGYGTTLSSAIPVSLARMEWDGQDVLGKTTVTSLTKGSSHTLTVACKQD